MRPSHFSPSVVSVFPAVNLASALSTRSSAVSSGAASFAACLTIEMMSTSGLLYATACAFRKLSSVNFPFVVANFFRSSPSASVFQSAGRSNRMRMASIWSGFWRMYSANSFR